MALAIIERAPFMIDVFAYTFLLLLVVYDLWSMRKVHRATIWGGLFLVVMQQLELPIGKRLFGRVLRHGR
jgi:hypothetical protein